MNSALGDVNLQNDLDFSLCVMPFICHMVTTSDDWMKSKMEVSADQHITVEYQRLSLIEIIFINYQTSKLQSNYIQVGDIGNAQDFSNIAPIVLSRGFSSEILIGVRQKNSAMKD